MNILDLAAQYNRFQNDIGQFLDKNVDLMISTLFANSFKKIVNGIMLVPSRNALKNQLFEVRQHTGKWTIDVKDMAAFQDSKRCLIRYHLFSLNLGIFDVMATLRRDEMGCVEEIDEIYYQITL